MQPIGRQNMGFEQSVERLQHADRRADHIGGRRQADLDTLTGEALALPVQRLVLAELLKEDHRQQTRAEQAARDDVERRRWLADLLGSPGR